MHFKQFYLGCLAHASYLIGSRGEAAVVDPRRDVDEYLQEAERLGLRIRHVVETHLHADFVSGHLELAERTGAEIVFGARAEAAFPHRAVRDGDEVRVGAVVLRVIETPGHTPEGISLLVTDTESPDEPRRVLTGDTLFIGDVGRPDLAGGRGFTAEQMAEMLYASLHDKLLGLDDAVEVYPAHGAGSLCGRNISKQTSSTIGEQRRSNYALQPMSRESFVRLVTADLPEVPRYFPDSVARNRSGAPALAGRPKPAAFGANSFRARAEAGGVVLDVRDPAAFGAGHLPGAIHMGLRGEFAPWAGTLLDPVREILLVVEEPAAAAEAVTRLARVGIESARGYLDGGVAAWDRLGLPLDILAQVDVHELAARLTEGPLQVVDVRRPGEYAAGHVPGAVNLPLDRLETTLNTLDHNGPAAVMCAGGYRSSIASSLLQRHGFEDLVNVIGGMTAWQAAGMRVE